MGFDSRDKAKPYEPQEGDTLRSIANRETAEGNPITWQDLARFNWGTDNPVEVNAFLRDKLGTRKRDADNNFVIAADDEPHGKLVIPKVFSKKGLATETTHTLRVRKKDAPPQFLECCHIPGVTFAFDSSFIRPHVVGYLKKLEAVAGRHLNAKIIVFGHTDAVGSDEYNKNLSDRRAWSAYAFVINDADAWEDLYNHPDEQWGLQAVQEILKDMGHYHGTVDGDWGPMTQSSIREFRGLPDDAAVQNDTALRKELFAAYMSSKYDIKLGPERFMDPGFMGCSEFNKVTETESEAEQNRRVTFFFVHQDRIPTLPCALGDIGPCQKQFVSLEQRHHSNFKCSFFDSLSRDCKSDGPIAISTIRVRLFDPNSKPIPGAPYKFKAGAHSQEGKAAPIFGGDPSDKTWIEAIVADLPDTAFVEWGHPQKPDSDKEIQYPYKMKVHLDYEKGGDPNEQSKRRLNNLGYPPDGSFEDNVRAFQHDYKLPETGEVDGATDAQLKSAHDTCEPKPESS